MAQSKKRMDHEDRTKIEVLYIQQGFSQEEIAAKLSVNQSTLNRELTRGMRNGEYNAKRAQRAANTSISSRKHKHQKIQRDVQEKVIALLGKRFSPQQIATTLFKEDGVKISRVAVYGFIKREDRAGNLVQFLRRGGGRGRRRRGTNRLKIPNRTDISERPGFVNTPSRYGDWECDLIEGAQHSGYFLSVVERKSRYGVLRKLENKKSEIVAEEVTRALQGFQVFTITYDNGTEFAKHELVNASLGCQSFFCQPYASWEKGGVENFNGLVRDFYPK